MIIPQVSIILPVYNYAKFLKETLINLQDQELTNWECIIVNDGSTDNTSIIAESFINSDSRFKYIYQENRGLSAARNTGIKIAKGEYIQLLDADDIISPQKLILQLNFMEENPGIDVSYTDAYYFDNDKPDLNYKAFSISKDQKPMFSNVEWIPEFDEAGIKIVDYLLLHNIAPVNSFLIRSEIFKKIGGFDESYSSLEDWEMWFRCALSGSRFSKFNHRFAFAKVRVHANSMTFSSHKMNLHLVRLQKAMIFKLLQLNSSESLRVIKKNKKYILKHFRHLIRETGLSNFTQQSQLAKEIGRFKFFSLYIREYCRSLKHFFF